MSTKNHEALAMGVLRTCSHLALIAYFWILWEVDAEKIIWITHVNLIDICSFRHPLSDDNWHGRLCVEGCEKNGCVNGLCFDNCKSSSVNMSANGKPYLKWTLDTPQDLLKWDCTGECRYQCMLREESSRDSSAEPIKYHGKWPFLRILNIQVHSTILSLGGWPV